MECKSPSTGIWFLYIRIFIYMDLYKHMHIYKNTYICVYCIVRVCIHKYTAVCIYYTPNNEGMSTEQK